MNKGKFLERCKKLVVNFIIFGESKVTEDKKELLEILKKEVEETKTWTIDDRYFDHLLKYLDNLWKIAKGIVYNKEF